MPYRLAALAEQDLEEIWSYVAEGASPATADRLIDAFVDRFALLAEQPRMGRLRPEFGEGVRSLTVENHVICYRHDGDVLIARVLHARCDQGAAWSVSDGQFVPSHSSHRPCGRLARPGATSGGTTRAAEPMGARGAAHVALTEAHADAAAILAACLDPNDLTASQEVGEFLQTRSIHAIVFPSAIPGFSGRNLVVFQDVIPAPSVVLVNREQIIEEFRRLAHRVQP